MLYGLLGFVSGISFAAAVVGIAAACFFARRSNGGSTFQPDSAESEQRRERLERQYENLMRYNGNGNNQIDIESDWR